MESVSRLLRLLPRRAAGAEVEVLAGALAGAVLVLAERLAELADEPEEPEESRAGAATEVETS